MKIVYVITQGSWGGAQAHLYDLLETQTNAGNDIYLITGTKGRLTEQVGSELPQVKQIWLKNLQRSISILNDARAIYQIRRLLNIIQPDIVHLHSSKAGTLGRLAAIKLVPTIFTVHGWAFTDGVSKKRAILALLIERLMQPLTTHYICVSQYDYQLGQQKKLLNHRHSGTVVHNGVKATELVVPKMNRIFRVTMAARFNEQKRQDLLIRAFAGFSAKYECRLVLLGDGPYLERCRELVYDLGLEDKVIFKGNVQNVTVHYQETDVVALISNYEGLPISLAEGLAAGKPLIASHVGGVAELFQNNGFLVKNDIEEIQQALIQLATNVQLRHQQGRNSRQLYRQLFTQQQMLIKTEQVYQKLLARRTSDD